MAEYITKMFDRLDKICQKRYGDTENGIVEYVLEQNPGLEQYDIVLPMGLKVYLPDRPQDKKNSTPVVTMIRLWN